MDIIILIVLIVGILIGYKRGLINGIFSLIGGILALILALATYKPIATSLVPLTGLDVTVHSYIQGVVDDWNGRGNSLSPLFEGTATEQSIEGNSLSPLLEGMTGSDVIINQAGGDVVTKVSNFVVNMLTLGALFIIYTIIIMIIKNILNNLAELPVLDIANKLGGATLGLIQAICIILIIFAGIYFANMGGYAMGINGMINDSKVGKSMYNNNVVVKILVKTNLSDVLNKAQEGVDSLEGKVQDQINQHQQQ